MTCEDFKAIVDRFSTTSRGERASWLKHGASCPACAAWLKGQQVSTLSASDDAAILAVAALDNTDAEYREVAFGKPAAEGRRP